MCGKPAFITECYYVSKTILLFLLHREEKEKADKKERPLSAKKRIDFNLEDERVEDREDEDSNLDIEESDDDDLDDVLG